MIVRIMGEGQYRLDESALDELNTFDDRVQAALDAGDQDALQAALSGLLASIRRAEPLADDELCDSDLVVPDETASLEQVRGLLAESGSSEGLIPG